MFWTLEAVAILAAPFGLSVSEMPGRSWAFLVKKHEGQGLNLREGLPKPHPENLRFLNDGVKGESLLSTLTAQTLRAEAGIARLEAHNRELQRASYIPLLGYAKVEEVKTPLFTDRFMGDRLDFSISPLQPVRALRLVAYRPGHLEGTIHVNLTAGQHTASQTVGSGVFSMSIDFPAVQTERIDIAISANPTYLGGGSEDERELSIIIDRIELVHPNHEAEAALAERDEALTQRDEAITQREADRKSIDAQLRVVHDELARVIHYGVGSGR
jgi:hypothetical protein